MAGKVGAQPGESKAGRLFCFGFGYTAQALARSLGPEGWSVVGTSRGGGKGLHAFERGKPFDFGAMAGATHVLISIPPDEEGDPVFGECVMMLDFMADLEWTGYLSTTGVYGDHGGAWVDESSPPLALGVRGRRRFDAEQEWLSRPTHVFRLAGIYGPGRSQLDALRAGTAKRIDKPGQVFSRIHVDDIVGALRLSMAAPRPGAIYNLADDEPAPPQDVVAYAAELLGVPPPPLIPFGQAELSPMAASFYAESKRVSNALIKRELGWRPRYPTYREGLRALL